MKAYKAHETYTPPIVLDCEASGLAKDSYPIEIGFILPAGEVTSFLIKPETEWTHWDEIAERKIHHISRETIIEKGIPAHEAATILNGQLSGCTVYSDAPDYERMWLDRLFAAAGQERYFDVENLFVSFVQYQHRFFFQHKAKLRLKVTAHRAGDDAWVLQEASNRSRIQAIEKIEKDRQ